MTNVNCPKCDGKGYIDGMSHIANGVCFCCKGQKKIEVNMEAKKSALSEYARKGSEWIMESTEDSYRGLSYSKLLKIRDFAHAGGSVREAYPNLLAHYREVGEPAFQAAQSARLATY